MESAIASNNVRHIQTAIDVTSGLTPTNEAVRDKSEFDISSSDQEHLPAAAAALHPSPERREHASMDKVTMRRRDHRSPGRRMDDEAIAGTAVGVILAFALLVCCLYPVVVYYIKKHRRSKRLSWESEYATSRGYPPGTRPRRLSSSDKVDENGKEINYSGQDTYTYTGPQGQTRQPNGYDASNPVATNTGIEPAMQQRFEPYSTPFPYYQDATPLPPPGPYPYVLKGTSEDYYSPYVPSEAFGMFPTPEPAIPPPCEPQRSAQRGSSFRQNVRSLLRRKNDREPADNSLASTPYSDYPAQEPSAQFQLPPQQGPGPMVMPQYYPTGQMIEHSGQQFPNPYYTLPGTLVDMPTMPTYTDSSASQASSVQGLPFPVLGTVNPMDIMQPSTESEIWHNVDHHLYSSAHDSSPGSSSSLDGIQVEHAAPTLQLHLPMGSLQPIDETSAANAEQRTSTIIEAPTANHIPLVQSFMTPAPVPSSIPSVPHTAPVLPSLRPSKATHLAQPASTRGPSSTNPSTLGSPSTHGDSPSPGSLNSSEPRQSISPSGGAIVSSPKGGVYRCDEPGCNQSFDQPHKLKHHQRYHSKDHKCPYPTCGKGFGTKTHLQRHINDRHEKKKKFHCSISGCDYSRAGGKAFPRKDNWKRHMTKIHGMDHGSLPEPVEIDQEMSGA